jgi:hypothetical protein
MKKKSNGPSLGGPCGSWTKGSKPRAAQPWRIHTPKSRWFGPVTVRQMGEAA